MDIDKSLYKEFLEGNKKSLDRLMLKYKNNLLYFITRFTNNIDISEDIYQEVALFILENKEYYNFDYSFKTYMYMIAKSKAVNYIKNRKITENIDENEEILKEENLLEEIILTKERQKKIQTIINQMPQDYQLVVYLTQIEDMSYKETAIIMEKKESQIKKLSYNARRKLRQLFIDEKIIEIKNNKIIKLISVLIIVGVISTGVVFAKDIGEFINKLFFGGSKGIETAIDNEYITNNDEDVENNENVRLSSIIMDKEYMGIKFDLNIDNKFEFDEEIENNEINFEKVIIYDEANNILYCNNKEIFDNFCKNKNIELTWKENTEKYINSGVSIYSTENNNCIYNLYSDGFPNSEVIYIDIENIILNNKNDRKVINGIWNLKMELIEEMHNREYYYFKEETNINDIDILDIIVAPTNTTVTMELNGELEFENRKDIKTIEQLRAEGKTSQEITNILAEYSRVDTEFQFKNIYENVYIENANGIKFYQDLDLPEGNKSEINRETNTIKTKFTFSLTQYDSTDVMYLNFNFEGRKYKIELIAY